MALVLGIDLCLLSVGSLTDPWDLHDVDGRLYDGLLYKTIASRVRRGEDYYAVAAIELASRGYPLNSVFNWRLPVYAWLFGKLPTPCLSRLLLFALAAVEVAVGCAVIRRAGRKAQAAAGLGLVGSHGWLLYSHPPYFMELWSGILVAISACCLGLGRWGWGALSAAAALLLRELALPYVLLASVLAMRRRRWRFLVVSLLTVVAYLVLYHEHYRCVLRHAPVVVSARPGNWISLQGLPMVLSTCRANFMLAALPPWFTALYLPLSLLGLLGWEGTEAVPVRSTAIVYLLAFAFVGNPYNFYWGWMCAPLLLLGLILSPRAIWDLVDRVSR